MRAAPRDDAPLERRRTARRTRSSPCRRTPTAGRCGARARRHTHRRRRRSPRSARRTRAEKPQLRREQAEPAGAEIARERAHVAHRDETAARHRALRSDVGKAASPKRSPTSAKWSVRERRERAHVARDARRDRRFAVAVGHEQHRRAHVSGTSAKSAMRARVAVADEFGARRERAVGTGVHDRHAVHDLRVRAACRASARRGSRRAAARAAPVRGPRASRDAVKNITKELNTPDIESIFPKSPGRNEVRPS